MKKLVLNPCFLMISSCLLLSFAKVTQGSDLEIQSITDRKIISSSCLEFGVLFASNVGELKRDDFCFRLNYQFSGLDQEKQFCDVADVVDIHPSSRDLFYVKKDSDIGSLSYYVNICLNENYDSLSDSIFPTSFDNISQLSLSLQYRKNWLEESVVIIQDREYFAGNQAFMSQMRFLSGFKKIHVQDEPIGLPRLIFREGETALLDNEATDSDANDKFAYFIVDITNAAETTFKTDNQTFSAETIDNSSFYHIRSQTIDFDNLTDKNNDESWLSYLGSKFEAESMKQCYFVLPHANTSLETDYECIRCNLNSDNNTVESNNKAYLIKASSFTMDNQTLVSGGLDNITIVEKRFNLKRNTGLRDFTGLDNDHYYVAFALFSQDNNTDNQMIRYNQDNDTTSNQDVGTGSTDSRFMCRLFKPERNYTFLEVLNGRDQSDTALGSPRCFIATAAYGSSLAEEVVLFRWFREQFLLTNSLGKAFVEFYYETSPAFAKIISESPFLGSFVRFFLWPIALLLKVLKFLGGALFLAFTSLASLFVVGYFFRRKRSLQSL